MPFSRGLAAQDGTLSHSGFVCEIRKSIQMVKNITIMFCSDLRGVSSVLHGCFKKVSKLFQESFKDSLGKLKKVPSVF